MSINGPLIDDYESREKHKKTPTIRCAKNTKKMVYTILLNKIEV